MFAPNEILKTAAPDFLKDLDLTDDELLYLLDLAAEVKAAPGDYAHALDGKNVGMLFEKPSLRTKLTFELTMKQMGGGSVFLQSTVDGLAEWSRVPVINALSDLYHPCQALADIQTIRERFGGASLHGLKQIGRASCRERV